MMFKGINVGRPWPETGMTSEKWLDVRLQVVFYKDLIVTQRGIFLHALMDEELVPVGGDRYIHVIRWKGDLYLEDGHTRVVRNMVNGYNWSRARVLNLT